MLYLDSTSQLRVAVTQYRFRKPDNDSLSLLFRIITFLSHNFLSLLTLRPEWRRSAWAHFTVNLTVMKMNLNRSLCNRTLTKAGSDSLWSFVDSQTLPYLEVNSLWLLLTGRCAAWMHLVSRLIDITGYQLYQRKYYWMTLCWTILTLYNTLGNSKCRCSVCFHFLQ